jgi:hypothetical protein
MKKATAAFGLLLVLGIWAGQARAQSSIIGQIAGDKAASDKLYFGFKFGLSCGLLSGVESGDRLGGLNLGFMAMIKLGERLSLAPELTLISRRGITKIPFVTTGDPALDPYFAEPARSALVLNYLDVPVVLVYRLGRFHVGAGAFVGSLGSASERFVAEIETGEEIKHTRDVIEDYRKLNYGLVLEASWTITQPRRGEGLVFHVRYMGGLADIVKDPAVPGSVRTSGLQIFLTFPFIR